MTTYSTFNGIQANLTDLDVRCMEHRRPEPMRFIGFGRSSQGEQIAIYACPACNYREAYAIGRRDGRPFRLFFKFAGQ